MQRGNNTTIGNRLYAWRKSPIVTNLICNYRRDKNLGEVSSLFLGDGPPKSPLIKPCVRPRPMEVNRLQLKSSGA